MTINWDAPEERLSLIDSVGLPEYNRLHEKHREQSIIDTVNGHKIRPVQTRFGRLFHVGNTKMAFDTMEKAIEFANTESSNIS